MKLRLSLFILLTGIFIFSSCNRENTDSPYANDSIPKIHKIAEYYNGAKRRESVFTYDSAARLIKVAYNEMYAGEQYYDTLTYSANTVIWTTFNSKKKIIEQEVFTLNSNHMAVLMTDTLGDENKSARLNFKFGTLENESNIYDYDLDGYQTLEITSNEFGGIHRFEKTFSNGNLVSSIYQYMANDTVILNGNSTFNYFDKSNTIGNLNRGIFFLGKQSTNLISSLTDQRWHSTDTLNLTTSYRYEFDSRKRVVKQFISPQQEESDDVTYLVFSYR